jgi:hypothetical protein
VAPEVAVRPLGTFVQGPALIGRAVGTWASGAGEADVIEPGVVRLCAVSARWVR